MLGNRSNSHGVLVAALAVASLMPSVRASVLTVYGDSTSFNAAAPGLPVMTFQPVQSQPFRLQAPLSSTSHEDLFAPGNILPGLTISNAMTANSRGLYVDFDAVGLFNFDDSLVLSFAPGVTAFGANFFSSEGTLPVSIAGTFTVDIYSGAALLGERTFNEAAGKPPSQGPFFGVTSTAPITSAAISFSGNSDGVPFVNNIAFPVTVLTVPEPDTFILAGVAALIWAMKWRRAQPH